MEIMLNGESRAVPAGASPARVIELLADQIEGDEYVDTKLVIKARKAA